MSQEIPSCGPTHEGSSGAPAAAEHHGDFPSSVSRPGGLVPGQRALGALSVVGGEMILRAANLAAAVVIARLFGATALGLYASALAFATVLITVSDNGLQIQVVPEATRKRRNTSAVVGEFYIAKTFLFLLAAGAALAIARVCHLRGEAWTVSALLIAKMMGYSYGQINFGVLKANERAPAIGAIQSAHACLLLLVICIAWKLHLTLSEILLFAAIIQLLEVFVSFRMIPHAGTKALLTGQRSPWFLIQRSAPVGVVFVLANFILRSDTIIMSALGSKEVVGYFAAANQGLTVIYVASWQFGSVLLPHLVDCERIGTATLYGEATRVIRRTWLYVAPAAALGAFLCPWLIRSLYGNSFARAGPLAAVMVFAAPLICSNAVYFNCFLAQRRTGLVAKVYALTAALAAVSDWTLGWLFGPLGIAFAILARELLLFIGWKQLAAGSTNVFLQHASEPLPGIGSGTATAGR